MSTIITATDPCSLPVRPRARSSTRSKWNRVGRPVSGSVRLCRSKRLRASATRRCASPTWRRLRSISLDARKARTSTSRRRPTTPQSRGLSATSLAPASRARFTSRRPRHRASTGVSTRPDMRRSAAHSWGPAPSRNELSRSTAAGRSSRRSASDSLQPEAPLTWTPLRARTREAVMRSPGSTQARTVRVGAASAASVARPTARPAAGSSAAWMGTSTVEVTPAGRARIAPRARRGGSGRPSGSRRWGSPETGANASRARQSCLLDSVSPASGTQDGKRSSSIPCFLMRW